MPELKSENIAGNEKPMYNGQGVRGPSLARYNMYVAANDSVAKSLARNF